MNPAINNVIGTILPPPAISNITNKGGAGGLGLVLSNIIQVVYALAGIAVVFMIVLSATQWIISGGDKDLVAQARSRLTYAILGLILLGLTFAILNVFGQVTGFFFFQGQTPP